MIRYAYNHQLQPDAPFVLVSMKNPLDGTEARDLPAQLDTAADRTVIPLAFVEALGLIPLGTVHVGGFGGHVSEVPLHAVLLGVHSFEPSLIRVVAHTEESWILLGRDVLNRYRVVLDGPEKSLVIGAASVP